MLSTAMRTACGRPWQLMPKGCALLRAAQRQGGGSARDAIAERSPVLLRFFGALFARDLVSSFHAVRCSGVVPSSQGPLVLFANHPSWWDGELFCWLGTTMFADRRCFVPIKAAMLQRYRFFRRLGAFAVAPGYAGAATFLRVGKAVLDLDDGLLLVNAEGRFRDVRDRPLKITRSLVHLAETTPTARFVPLAIEVAFWDERRPNLLLRFGAPLAADTIVAQGQALLRETLTGTMDTLAVDAAARDPARFTTLLAGKTAINPVYDAWRRARAALKGRRFDPAHRAAPDRR